MAAKVKTTDPKGTEHIFVPNPTLNSPTWEQEYPPIITGAKFLRSIHTGQIFPNTPDLARRSDTMEPWFGEPSDYPDGTAPSITSSPVAGVVASAGDLVNLDMLEEI